MSVANGSRCQATMMIMENNGYYANQSTGCDPSARLKSANMPWPGCMITFFQTRAATGGMTTNGEMIMIRTILCPNIG